MGVITCKSCGTNFHELKEVEGTEQAYGCSAIVSGKHIRGHYGSVILDGHNMTVLTKMPDWVVEGLICDRCIGKIVVDPNVKNITDGFNIKNRPYTKEDLDKSLKILDKSKKTK
jgi:hypothetical protein